MTEAERIVETLSLTPLPLEGGHFRRTYTAKTLDGTGQPTMSAIYYLVTPEDFSRFHRVTKDELFHFYAGSPVELVEIAPDGALRTARLGPDVLRGERPQHLVPAGNWQALSLVPGGAWALLGTTVTPAFEYADFEIGTTERLLAEYPAHGSAIRRLAAPS